MPTVLRDIDFNGLVKSPFCPISVIPAPYQVRGKLQPESSPGENRDPVLDMVPDFRRDDAWTPVFTGVTTFYELIDFNH